MRNFFHLIHSLSGGGNGLMISSPATWVKSAAFRVTSGRRCSRAVAAMIESARLIFFLPSQGDGASGHAIIQRQFRQHADE